MGRRCSAGAAVLAALVVFSLPVRASRGLDFEDRVAAQRQIERVYYRHTLAATEPFETAVPDDTLEATVERYLEQSFALERVFGTPVTAGMLDRELERIVRDTRFPERLEEIFAALDRDAFLIRETLARASLVDRLMRNRTAGNPRALSEWSAWRRSARSELDVRALRAVAGNDPLPQAAGGTTRTVCFPDDSWRGGPYDDFEARDGHSAVWTGSLMLVWGGQSDSTLLDTGHRYDPTIDSWTPIETSGAPGPRVRHTAVWTGSRMLVWGGWNLVPLGDGGSYDPATNSWSAISNTAAPSARENHSAVWTDTHMIVWGGRDSGRLNTGGRYDPATNSWSATTTVGAPAPRQWHVAVWAHDRMVVWGGWDGATLGDGGRYDPATDAWSAISATGAPAARRVPRAVWTDDEMIVWGGLDGAAVALNDGGRYDPVADSWSGISGTGAPQGRSGHSAVWTGDEMIIWGGSGLPGPLDDGGRYDPVADAWSGVAGAGAPQERSAHTAVWTGDRMIVWGGTISTRLRSGGVYDPVLDLWTPTGPAVPADRGGHSAVWTGNRMIVWGGSNSNVGFENTGGVFDALLGSWTATAVANAPSARAGHTAVWSGTYMIVWGGNDGAAVEPLTGGRYNPASDTWFATSTVNAPPGRLFHTAVWSGNEMIVWGGFPDLQAGGRYDPVADHWTPVTTTGAPTGRYWHTAVWTGGEMIVWGGYDDPSFLTSGGRYDPASDSWNATASTGAPEERAQHTATWTGSRMLVWGGNNLSFSGGGQRYDNGYSYNPTNNKWTGISSAGAPSARDSHSVVWTGSEMLVWGGQAGPPFTPVDVDSGGRYDPGADSWTTVSTVDAPSARREATAVWTGSEMLVWGGDRGSGPVRHPADWGRYALGHASDDDGDGVTECGGDCDDADATIYPGASELCDNRDNDCDGTLPASEADGDGDGSPFCADCDDADPTSWPDAPELCDNRDNDCDTVVDQMATTCGLGECVSAGFCTAGVDSCVPGTPSAEVCDRLDNDCDGVVPVAEMDTDGDGFAPCEGDCDDARAATYPGAAEVNDGRDNHCPGDVGYGYVDEIEGLAGFFNPFDLDAFCWDTQPLATEYEPSRSEAPDRPVNCTRTITAQACWSDGADPPRGVIYYYLVRALCGWTGSLGDHTWGCENPFPACIDD